jgi:hypothetical protein
MNTVYLVVGEAQIDESSMHWNAAAFSDNADAVAYMQALPVKIEEYLPKLFGYLHEIEKEGLGWEERHAKRQAAYARFRLRTGDAGYHKDALMDPSVTKYKIEELVIQ